jgi:transposase
MNRPALTQKPWRQFPSLLPPPKPPTGRPAVAPRRMRTGSLWRLRPGAPWRDLPERSGPWRPVARRVCRGRKAGRWARLFAAVQHQAAASGPLDGDVHAVEGTMVRVPQHAAGAKKGRPPPRAGAGQAAAGRQAPGGPQARARACRWAGRLARGRRPRCFPACGPRALCCGPAAAGPRAVPSVGGEIRATAASGGSTLRGSMAAGAPCHGGVMSAGKGPVTGPSTAPENGENG